MLERGTLVAFDAGAYEAIVRYAGSISAVVDGVPVSRGIAAAELTAGRRVAVMLFDAGHPADAMIVSLH